jgi:hypothetical protein
MDFPWFHPISASPVQADLHNFSLDECAFATANVVETYTFGTRYVESLPG